MPVSELKLDKIRMDGGTQSREKISQDTVSDYAELYAAGVELPHPVVFNDGAELWLADGFHRVHAARQAGKKKLACDCRTGTQRDAILHAAGSNAHHGLRRAPADKRKAVAMLLADAEWAAKSDRWIADTALVSAHLVASVRRDLEAELTARARSQTPTTKREGKDGRVIETAKIGKVSKAEPDPESDETAGPCPHGGEHEYSDGVCVNCFDPEPESEADTQDEPEAVTAAEVADDPCARRMADYNAACRAFITAVGACLREVPDNPWLDENTIEHVKGALKRATNAVRQQMAHAACPRCGGKGCGTCLKTGYLPKMKYECLPPHERGE